MSEGLSHSIRGMTHSSGSVSLVSKNTGGWWHLNWGGWARVVMVGVDIVKWHQITQTWFPGVWCYSIDSVPAIIMSHEPKTLTACLRVQYSLAVTFSTMTIDYVLNIFVLIKHTQLFHCIILFCLHPIIPSGHEINQGALVGSGTFIMYCRSPQPCQNIEIWPHILFL